VDPEQSELSDTAKMLNDVAGQIAPDPAFTARLEHRLTTSPSGPEVSSMLSLKRITPALLWVLAAIVMVLVVDLAIRSLAPAPVPAARHTQAAGTSQAPAPPVDQSTPVPSNKSYDWHGTTLYVAASLPESPAEADVYLGQPAAHATTDEALALAQRFGIQGNLYQNPGEIPGTTDFLVTDGKQSLRVRSSDYFNYTADIIKSYNYLAAVKNPNAQTIIGTFLQSHGFTFPCRIEWSDFRNAYLVEPLTSDGTPLRYEDFAPPMLLIMLDQDGQVAILQASLLGASSDPVGHFGILSTDEAFQRLLDPNTMNGLIESTHSAEAPTHQWNRAYPADQTLTIYGSVSSAASVQPDQPAFIQIDDYPVVGQVSGLDRFSQPTYVAATGRFTVENGIEKFSVDSWKLSDVNEDGFAGTLKAENGQTTLITQDGARYTLPDVPADLPMPFENAYVIGTREGDVFQWKLIDDRMASGGGGGGGGGSGFYKLNLTGTPVPFPSPTAASATTGDASTGGTQYVVKAGDTLGSIASAYGADMATLTQANGLTDPNVLTVGQTLIIPGSGPRAIEALRGMLTITISKQQDGSQFVAYGFLANAGSVPSGYMLLEGADLQALQAYNSRPVDIWGSLEAPHDNGIPVIKVDRCEIPFPDLKVQVLAGTQKLTQISGQPATLFTSSDGITYVQLLADGTTGSSLVGKQGDQMQLEAVAVPGESVGGYPGLHVFAGSLADDPKTGQPLELTITADKPSVIEGPFIGKPATAPTATIEKVELVLFTSDPRYAVAVPGAQPPFFQPVWRFNGHYSNGDEFEILVQAVRGEYLLPELDPYLQGG
jgi:LysM repeat protein